MICGKSETFGGILLWRFPSASISCKMSCKMKLMWRIRGSKKKSYVWRNIVKFQLKRNMQLSEGERKVRSYCMLEKRRF